MLYIDFKVPEEKLLWTPKVRYNLEYDQLWFKDPEVIRIAESVDELAYGSKTVNIDEFYTSLPSAVRSRYADKLQCVIDNIHMLV